MSDTQQAKILIADDERGMREVLGAILGRAGHGVLMASSGEQAIEMIGSDIFDVVITDLKMSGPINGMDVLKSAKELSPETMVIVLTAFATFEVGIEAMRLGAYDVLPKPFNNDHVELTVRKAIDTKRLTIENHLLKRELKGRAAFENIIGISEPMQKVFGLIRRIADTSSTVLIEGESGTGKELVARAIHFNSPRREKAFVSINCAALPETLLESELFGHMRGAFTGSVSNKEGLFEVADGGTLFLDEIAEAPASIQAKLLRAIQEQEFRRVGGIRDIKVNVRIIAATNKDLAKAVMANSFREDLYYRLNVIPITLPPLRARPEDIPALVQHFLGAAATEDRSSLSVDADAMRALQQHEWKGNVRELENMIQRVVALARGPVILGEDIQEWIRPSSLRATLPSDLPPDGLDLEDVIGGIERDLLMKALERSGGVKKKAARLLRLNTRSFRYRLEKYGIARANGVDEEQGEGDDDE